MGQVALDSASVFIPLDELNVLDLRLVSAVAALYLTTGEITNPRENASIRSERAGYSISYKRVDKRIGKQTIEGVSFTVSSKMLEESYLRGISHDTVARLHQTLMDDGVLRFSVETLLSARIYDVDLKIDFPLPENYPDFNSFIRTMKQNMDKSMFGEADKPRVFRGKANKGLEIGRRETSHVNEHCKIYDKQTELEHNSNDFYSTHLGNMPLTSTVRFEANFKNTDTLRKYNLVPEGESARFGKVLTGIETHGQKAMETIKEKYFPSTDQLQQARITLEKEERTKEVIKVTECVRVCMLAQMSLSQTLESVLIMQSVNKNRVAALKKLVSHIYEYLSLTEDEESTFSDNKWF